MNSNLIAISTAISKTGIPKTTIYRWIRKGKLVSVNIDGVLFLPESELAKLKVKKSA